MANRIAGITVEIGGDTTKLSSALKNVNTEIKETQTQLKDVNNLLKLDPTNTTLLTEKQKDLNKAISDTKDKLDTLKTAAEQANEQLQKGEITQEQYDALQREIVETEQELKNLADQAAESNEALQKIGSVGDTLDSLGTKISDFGTKLTKTFTVAIGGLATAAVTTASNFETSMDKVQALITSSSDDIEGDIEKLEEKAREAGESTKFSATEAADAMSYMGLAGWDADQMIDGLDGILNLAAASEMDLASASDIVTDNLSAFGMEAKDSGKLVDAMAYAMSNSNTTTEQLGEAYKNCATTATQLGWDVDDVTAALMVMADNGAKGGEAGTALNSIMTRLANNTSGCADTLHDYGIEVYDSSGNLNDLGDILTGMQDVWGDLNDEEKANLAYKVAGKTAESELMAVLGDSTGSLEEYTDGLNNCNGTAEEMANVMQDNLAGQMTVLKSKLQELGISFGEILMPAIQKIVEWLQNFVDKLNNMDEGTKKTITRIGLLVAAIGPVLTIIGKLTSGVGKAMKSISSLGTSILKVVGHAQTGTGTIGKLVTAIGGISAPVVAVVAVVGTLVAAFATLWKTNDEFREKITGIWSDIKEKVCGFVDGIRDRFSDLGIELPSLGNIVDGLKNVWMNFCNLLAPVFEGAFSAVSNVLGTVLDVLTGLLDVFIGLFTGNWSQMWDGVKEIFSGIWDGIVGIFTTVTDTLKGIADVILGWFGTSVEECFGGIKTFFQNTWNNIKDFFSNITEKIKTAAKNAWNGIKTFFSDILGNIKDTFSNIWNGIKEKVSNVVDAISSTISRVFTAIKDTITNILGTIKETVSRIFANIKDGIADKVSKIYTAIKDGFNQAVDFIKNLAKSAFNWGADIINGIVDGIKSCINKIKDACSNIAETIKSFLHFSVPDVGPLADYESWMPDFMAGLAKGIEDSKSLVADAMDGVTADMVINPDITGTTESLVTATKTAENSSALSAITDALNSLNSQAGDIVIPVYLGNSMLDEVVVTANQRIALRSGGR